MQATVVLDIEQYMSLSDAELDIIFGQHIARNICDMPAKVNAEGRSGPWCSLTSESAHWIGSPHYAPDDEIRPQPVGAGGDEYDDAIVAAQKMLSPGAVEIVEQHEPGSDSWHVSVTHVVHGEREPIFTRAYVSGPLAAYDRHAIRRATIICFLAITYAPSAPRNYLVRLAAEAEQRRQAAPAEPMVGDEEHAL